MKRFILLLAVLCIGVQAHAGLVPKAKIGIKAGWNYQANKLKGAKDFDFNSDSGWYAGLQSELTWGMLGIRPELIYSRNTFDVAGPTGIDGSVIKALVKIVGIGYVADFSAGIVEESGSKALSEKIVLGGKVIIFIMSIPIIEMLFEIISSML